MPTREKLTTVISTKGQVILPKSVRDHKHWTAGTRLTVEDTPDGIILKAEPLFQPTRPEEVFGSLKTGGKPKSLAEMDAAVLKEAKRRHARGRH